MSIFGPQGPATGMGGGVSKLDRVRREDVIILKFTGELDGFNLPGLSKRIDQMVALGDNRLVLDLHQLEFINSAGIGYLLMMSKSVQTAGGGAVVARPSRFMQRTLSTLGLDQLFKVFDTVDDALAHFGVEPSTQAPPL